MSRAPYVLVVEDDPTNRLLANRILAASGIQTAEAVDGEQALEQLAALRPDLVLMDLSLPGIDGWEVARRIRRDPDLRTLPVIGVSAHAMADDRERALAAGCDDYLTKPYRPADLIAVIAKRIAVPGRPAPSPVTQAAADENVFGNRP